MVCVVQHLERKRTHNFVGDDVAECSLFTTQDKSLLCNGRNDCNEDFMCPSCTGGAFACGNSNCIPQVYVCDGDKDCPNASDERDCAVEENVAPYEGMVSCCGANSNETCEQSKRCNGVVDCHYTYEDELNCTQCSGFNCGDGQCIPSRFRCDGKHFTIDNAVSANDNCFNGADEDRCDMSACMHMTSDDVGFQCSNSSLCIEGIQRCDNVADCADGSDERGCEYVAPSYFCQRTDIYALCGDAAGQCYFYQPPEVSERCDGYVIISICIYVYWEGFYNTGPACL
jgi:hypothetical protein